MNKKLYFCFGNNIKLIINNVRFHRSLIVGPVVDNYLPTKFNKREKIVTVFGATGFFGDYLLHELVKNGYQLIIPYRGDINDFKHLRMIGGVGQNLFSPFSPEDFNSIELAVKHSNVVINLIGKEFQSHQYSYRNINADFAGEIARISKRCGVEQFIHMSALGASENPREHIPGAGCEYFKSKWLGEQEVTREFPGAVIIRPSAIWGKNDNFIFYFLSKYRRLNIRKPIIPIWKLGKETIKQPVYAEDVAKAISRIILHDKYKGCVIEPVGPQRFQLDHLVVWFYLNMKYKFEDIKIIELDQWFLLKAKWLPKLKYLISHYTLESLERECITDQPTPGSITLEHLDIIPCKLEDRLQWLVKPNHCIGYRWDEAGGFPPPPNPPLAYI